MLCDRLFCGINDQHLQHELLAEATWLSFDKALRLAQAMKAAEHNVKKIELKSNRSALLLLETFMTGIRHVKT